MSAYDSKSMLADVATVRGWYDETPCPVIDRILNFMERVAVAPTTVATSHSSFDCSDGITTDWVTFSRIYEHSEWNGKTVALVLLDGVKP